MKKIPSVAVEFLNEPKDIGSFLLDRGYTPYDDGNCKVRKYINCDKSIYVIYNWLEGEITLEGLWGVMAILPQNVKVRKEATRLGINLARRYEGIFYDDYKNPYEGLFKIPGDEE